MKNVVETVIGAVLIGLFVCVFIYWVNKGVMDAQEYSYFEGQKDALSGQVRIERNEGY